MQRPPPLRDAAKYPVTALVALGAVGVTLAFWNHVNINGLVAEPGDMVRAPWTLVTSALPHLSLPHLFFNLYWLWVFGTLIERVFGPLRFLGVVVLLAWASSAAELAVSEGGVGLSGVGYGLFGMLWALKRRPGFENVIDQRTIGVFVVWFFICIAATYAGLMKVGNAAHGAGCGAGYLLGMCVAAQGNKRRLRIAALIAALVVVIAGAYAAPPWLSLSRGKSVQQLFDQGTAEIKAGRYDDAIGTLRRALQQDPESTSVLIKLGVAYEYAGRHAEAIDALESALKLDPADKDVARALDALKLRASKSRTP